MSAKRSLWDCAQLITLQEGVLPEDALIGILYGIQQGEILANWPNHISAGLISKRIGMMITVIVGYQANGITLSLDSSELALAHEMTAEIDQITSWWRRPAHAMQRYEVEPTRPPKESQPVDTKDTVRIAEGVQMVKDGRARSANAAAKFIAERDASSPGRNAMRDRLGRNIRAVLRNG
jgi:hypothetical protein